MTAPVARWIAALLLATLAMGLVLVHAARAGALAPHPNAAAAATKLDRQPVATSPWIDNCNIIV